MPPHGAERVRRIIGDAQDVQPRLRSLSAAEFLRLELPPRGMVLEPILREKGLMMLHVYRGIGKTLLALGIGYSVASAGGVLGWSAPIARRVLYLDGEMPAENDAIEACGGDRGRRQAARGSELLSDSLRRHHRGRITGPRDGGGPVGN